MCLHYLVLSLFHTHFNLLICLPYFAVSSLKKVQGLHLSVCLQRLVLHLACMQCRRFVCNMRGISRNSINVELGISIQFYVQIDEKKSRIIFCLIDHTSGYCFWTYKKASWNKEKETIDNKSFYDRIEIVCYQSTLNFTKTSSHNFKKNDLICLAIYSCIRYLSLGNLDFMNGPICIYASIIAILI